MVAGSSGRMQSHPPPERLFQSCSSILPLELFLQSRGEMLLRKLLPAWNPVLSWAKAHLALCLGHFCVLWLICFMLAPFLLVKMNHNNLKWNKVGLGDHHSCAQKYQKSTNKSACGPYSCPTAELNSGNKVQQKLQAGEKPGVRLTLSALAGQICIAYCHTTVTYCVTLVKGLGW